MSWKISSESGACRGQEASLEEYLEGGLQSEQRWRLEAHLASCVPCSDALERACKGAALVRASLVPAPDPGNPFTRRVMARIGGEEHRREEERLRWRPLEVIVTRMALSAALALGALLSVTVWTHQAPQARTAQSRVLDLMPEQAHVTAASSDILMAAISEDHGR